MQALLHEFRTGQKFEAPSGTAHQAKVARGPTSIEDITEESKKREDRGKGRGEEEGKGALKGIEE